VSPTKIIIQTINAQPVLDTPGYYPLQASDDFGNILVSPS
jgi:hypothetical protein